MDLLTQLNKAMNYIEEHISDDIENKKISKVTNYSPYHFNRLFYYIADMPLSEYIRKRKLTLSAVELQNSNIKVIDLAVKYGYDSADSFTRAFVKQHGVTPTAARSPGVVLKFFSPLTFQITIRGVQEMKWRIEKKEAFEVFGIERYFPNDETDKIPDFWTELQQNGLYEKLNKDAGGERPMKEPSKDCCVVNALCGYAEDTANGFPYMLFALKNDNCKTDGYKIWYVPKATWAVFRIDGLKNHANCQIPALFHRAYSEWLPSSGYDKANGPDMEIYGADFEEVWIPVTNKD